MELTKKVVELQNDLRRLAQPILDSLVKQTGEAFDLQLNSELVQIKQIVEIDLEERMIGELTQQANKVDQKLRQEKRMFHEAKEWKFLGFWTWFRWNEETEKVVEVVDGFEVDMKTLEGRWLKSIESMNEHATSTIKDIVPELVGEQVQGVVGGVQKRCDVLLETLQQNVRDVEGDQTLLEQRKQEAADRANTIAKLLERVCTIKQACNNKEQGREVEAGLKENWAVVDTKDTSTEPASLGMSAAPLAASSSAGAPAAPKAWEQPGEQPGEESGAEAEVGAPPQPQRPAVLDAPVVETDKSSKLSLPFEPLSGPSTGRTELRWVGQEPMPEDAQLLINGKVCADGDEDGCFILPKLVKGTPLPAPQKVDVEIRCDDNSTKYAQAFTYCNPGKIESVSPQAVPLPGGVEVFVTTSDLGADIVQVSIGDVPCPFALESSISATETTVIAPKMQQNGKVALAVRAANGMSASSADALEYYAPI